LKTPFSIREVTFDDAKMILKWRTSEKVAKFMNSNVAHDIDAQEKWISECFHKKTYYHWIILYKKSPVGLINIQDYSEQKRTASWGFYIGEDNINGLGGFIPPFFYNWAFNKLCVKEIKIEVFYSNTRVIKMHLLHGYKFNPSFDRVIHKDNEDISLVSMSLTTSDWNHNRYRNFLMKFPIKNWSKAPNSIQNQ
jgi:UDP-4-amino-4,6-dideoxy-N-acetyl-beta-L-altrosamine N-acetyltransferase